MQRVKDGIESHCGRRPQLPKTISKKTVWIPLWFVENEHKGVEEEFITDNPKKDCKPWVVSIAKNEPFELCNYGLEECSSGETPSQSMRETYKKVWDRKIKEADLEVADLSQILN